MRIVVHGAGAVGGYFGARLVQAGEEVVFVARGRQLEALRARGLVIESIVGDVRLERVTATDDPASLGEADAVLVTTKTWQVEAAGRALRPLVGPRTLVVPLQNGVEAATQLERSLPAEAVAGGLTRILCELVAPGRIRHTGIDPVVVMGERDGRRTGRCARLAGALERAPGASVEVADDIEAELWRKFLMMCAVSGVCSVARVPLGRVRATPATGDLLRRCMEEAAAVAAARGVRLPDGAVAASLAFLDGLPPGSIPSMHRDIANGRPSELEQLSGAVVRLGRECGVATPVHQFIHAALLPAELAARGTVPPAVDPRSEGSAGATAA